MYKKVKSYKSFQDLRKNEREGKDFEIEFQNRNSRILIMAPHGGLIEPGTTEIARVIATNKFSFYSLIGKKKSGNYRMHLDSVAFDEPLAEKAVALADYVITIHGERGDKGQVLIGGLARDLIEKISSNLIKKGFSLERGGKRPGLGGINPKNLCNRGSKKEGIQIEIDSKLRNDLLKNENQLLGFAKAINEVMQLEG